MKYHRLYQVLLDFLKSTIVFGLLFYPIGLVHETGHAVVCISQDGTFPLDWFFFKLAVVCNPVPSPPELYWSMGGIFGFIASVLLIITVKRIRVNHVLLGGFIGSAIFQGSYAIAEGWIHYSYMGNDPTLFFSITVAVLLSIFYFASSSKR